MNIIKAILLYFLAFELVGLHLGHTCIVVQISIVYQVQVIEHHICMSIFYGHENNKVHGMINGRITICLNVSKIPFL